VHEVARILLYGLLAAASPTILLATLVMLGTGRGRANGTAFMLAYLLGTSIAFAIGLFVGKSITESRSSGFDLATFLELVVGAALLVLAFRTRGTHTPRESDARSPEARFSRFAHVRPAVSFGIGLPLGIGAKRLTITLMAAATVTLAEVTTVEGSALGAVYVTVASVTVCVPVIAYLMLGTRADDAVSVSRAWIAEHEQALAFASFLVLGTLLVADGVLRLLT